MIAPLESRNVTPLTSSGPLPCSSREVSSRAVISGSFRIIKSISGYFSRHWQSSTVTWVPKTAVYIAGFMAFMSAARLRSLSIEGVPVLQITAAGPKNFISSCKSGVLTPAAGQSMTRTSCPAFSRTAAIMTSDTGGQRVAQTPCSWVQRPSRINFLLALAGGLRRRTFN